MNQISRHPSAAPDSWAINYVGSDNLSEIQNNQFNFPSFFSFYFYFRPDCKMKVETRNGSHQSKHQSMIDVC